MNRSPLILLVDDAQRGIDALLVINGSPYERGKTSQRVRLAQTKAAEVAAPVAYLNLVGAQDDLVFDGARAEPYVETDAPAPLNVYGRSKLAGEQGIAKQGAKHVIFRTSWVYGTEGGNFAKTMLRLAQEREKMTVINDQFGAPTGAALLADITALALQTHQPLSGVYHVAASGVTTWFEYANHVLAKAKQLKPSLNYAVKEVLPVPTSEFPTPAQRPLNSRLNCSRLEQALQLQLPPWQTGVDQLLAKIL